MSLTGVFTSTFKMALVLMDDSKEEWTVRACESGWLHFHASVALTKLLSVDANGIGTLGHNCLTLPHFLLPIIPYPLQFSSIALPTLHHKVGMPVAMNATRYDRRMSVAILGSILLAIVLSGLRLFSEDIKSSKIDFTSPTEHNESRHHHSVTLLGRQVDTCDWANIVANSQDEGINLGYCERLYVEGSHLMCMLNDASQHQNQATGQMEYQWATEWTDPDSLEDWGWHWSSLPPGGGIGNKDLDQAFSDTDVNIDPKAWHNILISHSEETEHDGITYPETEGHFDNLVSQDFRALVASANWSPEYMNNEREPEDRLPPNQITKLRNWSDVIGLGWDIYAEEEGLPRDFMKNLQHVFRHGIINEETQRIMRMVFEVDNLNQLNFVRIA